MQSMLNLKVSNIPNVIDTYDTSLLAENEVFEISKSSKDTTDLLVKSDNSYMRVSYCSLSNRVDCTLSVIDSQISFSGDASTITIGDLWLRLWPALTNL